MAHDYIPFIIGAIVLSLIFKSLTKYKGPNVTWGLFVFVFLNVAL